MPARTQTETLDGNGTQWLSFAHGPNVAIVSLTIDGLEIPSLDSINGLRVGYMLLRDGLYLRSYIFTQNRQNVVVTYTVAAVSAIDDARRHLFRALEADGHFAREHFLWRAATALNDAGFPAWATLAEAAAQRTGGGDRDMSDLLFDVDRECGRRDHAQIEEHTP